MKHFRRAKIFGERNTATNAVTRVIAQNAVVNILPGVVTALPERFRSDIRLSELRRSARQKTADPIVERKVDHAFEQASDLLAWKHCATDFEDLSFFRNVLCVVLVRHPASWLVAFHRRPYHAMQPVPEDLAEFCRQSWKTVGRERLGEVRLDPVALYNRKIQSYFRFKDELGRLGGVVKFVRFEDFVMDQSAAYSTISGYLRDRQREFRTVSESTKDKSKDHAWYREYYANERWRERIDSSVQAFVNKNVDWSQIQGLGYEPL